jgi:hypothetical protein
LTGSQDFGGDEISIATSFILSIRAIPQSCLLFSMERADKENWRHTARIGFDPRENFKVK